MPPTPNGTFKDGFENQEQEIVDKLAPKVRIKIIIE